MKNQTRVTMSFDENGNFRTKTPNEMLANKPSSPASYESYFQQNKIPRAADLNTFHFHRLSKIRKTWIGLGTDARFHLSALVGCILCFSSVFFPALWFDDRVHLMESRAQLDPETLKRTNYYNYKRLKYGYSFDPYMSFNC